MVVPPYCRSRSGRVFRIQRISEQLGEDRMRYTLRASPISAGESREASREVESAAVREKIIKHQVVPTPEDTYDQLWQQLRLDLDIDTTPVDTT